MNGLLILEGGYIRYRHSSYVKMFFPRQVNSPRCNPQEVTLCCLAYFILSLSRFRDILRRDGEQEEREETRSEGASERARVNA